ncbi:phospholipase D-like domain-containing protein [Nocardioides sp. BP30]|uniref:phospholipase D-like domain-containing protein n=1 Tax=Nocardioides sp. BP30 TaxID=3036374 RepID=UPI0024698300|nr:phospholipase D-like domain-containing protein [Nocardioides sp. BP30]WGL51194.1 phospholipase D-like domain-containing protein [Nocardioides sp. BP30]
MAGATAAMATLMAAAVVALPMQADGAPGSTPTTTASASPSATPTTTPTPPVVKKPWMPDLGPAFNNPLGSQKQKYVVNTRILKAVKHAKPNSTIRFSTYSFDREDITKALYQAHKKKHVNVQVVVNHNVVTPNELWLQRRLGKNTKKSSFFHICRGSCRGKGGGNEHAKIYSFSATGGAKDLMIESSGNLTSGAAAGQWNDVFSIMGNTKLFDTWVKVFNQYKKDKPVKKRTILYKSKQLDVTWHRLNTAATSQPIATKDKVTTISARKKKKKKAGDPVLARLNNVSCSTSAAHGDGKGHTVIRIIMYAWFGNRSVPIARKVAALKHAGCNVEAILTEPGGQTVSILRAAGVPLRDAAWNYGEKLATDGSKQVWGPRLYSHLKWMLISGKYNGVNQDIVFAGSENWSGISFSNDEVTLQLTGAAFYKAYLGQFNHMWTTNATHTETGREDYGWPPKPWN